MNHQMYMKLSGIIFLILALAHLWRIINGFPITVGEAFVPVWASWAVIVIGAYLSYIALKKK